MGPFIRVYTLLLSDLIISRDLLKDSLIYLLDLSEILENNFLNLKSIIKFIKPFLASLTLSILFILKL